MSDTSRILRFPEVQKRIGGYTRMHVDRLEKNGKFPKRLRIGERAVGWLESDIDSWIADKAQRRGPKSSNSGAAPHQGAA
ncbi:helix-turn-helix transcriptional regulator [Azospirillum tabaci]|uniref:helix-turn-helix transcriptional regulator n=1 Tax=Azospirillum tabaci TaxID=2752310 RepID=UPI0016603BE8|nr:AlpA family phage regulatory protein [Azospirillum tabaci]